MKFEKFFSYIQETAWYYQFLSPVLNEVDANTKLLDIGTGSGKLIQLLSTEKNVSCVGIDSNQEMLDEASNKLKNIIVDLIRIEPNQTLPFSNNTFDSVTICNVLFHLDKSSIHFILDEAQRVLKKKGKIIILNPTGVGGFIKLFKNYFSINNISIYIWYYATKNRAGPWITNNYLSEYCKITNMKYEHKYNFNGFAQLEVITKT